ncbi:hypothetical protein L873DRAFT_1734807 [Choiromyces venosus 120613-1]|uniref:SMP-LTD domain-containing protein n=1 Tax=Choiromyces venosus 120613-1 TaxID=1336337 RepID=A0A3N4JZ72_9PEZI|nr:hypothetical protein L873DRAFT_1734807 [Choiromyces venosus 120613-1]
MSSFLSFLIAYLLGGITLLPLLLGLPLLYAYLTFPIAALDEPVPELKLDTDDDRVFKTDDEKLVKRLNNSADVAAGYFAVTREFVPGGVNGKPPERTSPAGNTQPVSETPSVYQTMYRSLFERKGSPASADAAKKAGRRARNEFFVVLRHGYLMLYDDSDQSEVRHVISLSLYSVSIYGGGEEIPEGELYIRRNAICLSRKSNAVDKTLDIGQNAMPFYLFSENSSLKEDFYFALLKNLDKSDETIAPPIPLRYEQKHILSLVQRLHSSEEHLQTNWVNGLFGRIFLAIYKTSDVEKFIRARITKKIARVNKPNFLSNIVLQKVHVGEGIPSITNPRLKEMTVDGDFCAEADLTYDGNFRLEVAAKATLQLASRFKPREVNLVLSVTLKRLEGHVLIRIKPPPSNRLWIAFETMPKMELDIEPIVGSRQVIWGPVLRTIEGRIREVIAETLVLPHYDDTPFTDTLFQEFRGGIWEEPAPSEPSEEESAAERCSIDGAEKEDNGEASQTPADTTLEETLDKSMSMPSLPQAVLGIDNKKAASTIGLSESAEGSRGLKSPGLKSSNGERKKKKSSRAQSLTSMAPPSPVVGTDAVNVTAVWGKDNIVDKGTATSAVMAMSRSRSSSSPNSPSTNSHPAGTPPSKTKLSQNSESSVEISNDQKSEKSSRSSIHSQAETDETATQADKDSLRPSTPNGCLSDSPTPSFISRTMTNASSSSSSLNRRPTKTTPEKITVAAVGTLTTAVRNWYKSRNVSGEAPTDMSTQSARKLPPAEIPLPPAKKTAPINVPKRKALPPPLLPTRNNTKRQVPPPPVPPRNPGPAGSDELLVVPAPDSEPTTPSSAVAEEGDSYLGRGGNESLVSNMMFPGNESLSASASVSPGMPRRGSSSPPLEEGSSWERDRKRLSKRNADEEETEQWHAAEEAELRTKVPWEPDEALT